MSDLLAVALDENVRRHVAEALRRYFIDLRKDGVYRPPAQLAEFKTFLEASVSLSSTQDTAEVDDLGVQSDDDGMLSREDAARFLGISVAHLDRQVAAGVIPSRTFGRRRVFSKTDLVRSETK